MYRFRYLPFDISLACFLVIAELLLWWQFFPNSFDSLLSIARCSFAFLLLSLTFVVIVRSQFLELVAKPRILRGTKIFTPKQFRRKFNGTGLGFPYSAKNDLLRIRQEDEVEHIALIGDTGVGKSAIIHSLLLQIALEREHSRVLIYDPALEFWNRHGNLERGDILLYPLFRDCPSWEICEEINSSLDAQNLAESFIPSRFDSSSDFWETTPRKILAFLLQQLKSMNAPAEQLLKWLQNPQEIAAMIAGTELEPFIDSKAFAQRAGVLASLNQIATALSFIPRRSSNHLPFSFEKWSQLQYPPWVFIGAASPAEQAALKPIISAWLDTGLNKLMRFKDNPPSFVFVDELPSLQRLPMVPIALAQSRKYNVRLVLSFQGKSQIEQRYGKEAQAMMSQPKTKVILRNSEYESAEWCARIIGKPEIESQDISFSGSMMGHHSRDSVSFRSHSREDWLVLPNEIQNLEKFQAYLKYNNAVVQLNYRYPRYADK